MFCSLKTHSLFFYIRLAFETENLKVTNGIENPNLKTTVIANPTLESTVIANPHLESTVIAIPKLQ